MRSRARAIGVVGAAVIAALAPHTGQAQAPPTGRGQPAGELRPPSAFAGIGDPAARSAALFIEAGKVLQHPRCPDGKLRPWRRARQPELAPGPRPHGLAKALARRDLRPIKR
jgi:hypothetical protein